MRLPYFYGLLALLACSATANEPQSPRNIALRIISEQPDAIYHPADNTEKEQNFAAGHNAAAQLRRFMLGDSVPEEIRVCYAMQILVDRLMAAHRAEYRDEIMRERAILVAYLRELNQRTK